jgi:hypothetical protein
MATREELLKLVATLRKQNKDDRLIPLVDQLEKGLAELEPADVPVSRVAPVDLARSFKGVIEEIQAEARSAQVAGVTIKAMDVEVKGLVQAEADKTQLVLPAATGVDPGSLSTLRISFGVVPAVQAEEAPLEPAAPPRQPRPRRPS